MKNNLFHKLNLIWRAICVPTLLGTKLLKEPKVNVLTQKAA